MATFTSTPSDNILQSVITYQDSLLARLLNDNPWIATANMKFKNFQDFTGNLGDTVSFDLPPRFIVNDTLVVTDQPAIQRVQQLTVDQQKNVSYPFTAQQFIFNVQDYMKKFGDSAMAELGQIIGSNVAQNAISHTYRCYDATSGGITSYQQYAQALANLRNYGAPKGMAKVYTSDVSIPAVIGSGLNQFAQNRNNEIANSWELGQFSQADFYATNILAVHTAGTAAGHTLTVTAINTAGDSITFSGAGAANTLVAGDILTFDASRAKGLNFLTFTGHLLSSQLVQVRVTANATADGSGNITASIFPALISDPTNSAYNINLDQQTTFIGTTATVVPSHRAGLITAGDPLFLAMPRLPEEVPYPTAVSTDPETGASSRSYYGSVFGQNIHRYVHDAIWGSTLVDEYAMRIALPL